MKKPFVALRGRKNMLCILVGTALLLSVLWLFFAPEEGKAVFADGDKGFCPKGVYGLLDEMI